jgi:ATP-dependent Clp protease protease subunit
MAADRGLRRKGEESGAEWKRVGNVLYFTGAVGNELHIFLASNLGPGLAKPATRLILNSPGGDEYSCYSVIDLFESIDGIPILATGYCMSAAVPIVAAGRKGKRFATPRTRFMIHAGWTTYGRPMDRKYMECEKDEMDVLEDIYAEVLAKHTGYKNEKWWRDVGERDAPWYFSAEEALKMGLIDGITGFNGDPAKEGQSK